MGCLACLHREDGIALTTNDTTPDGDHTHFRGLADLLGPNEVRELAERLGVRPTKTLGQNFMHDANSVRRIVRTSRVTQDDVVLEIGPGLGSLTLPLLDVARHVVAVEIDPLLADQLPHTVEQRAPQLADRLTVVTADAMAVSNHDVGPIAPTALVANLPYNISVPVLLHLLATVPTLRSALVLVQAEVADRLAAQPGNRVYGVPSVKAGFFGTVKRAGTVGRTVFWPVPNVESGLVRIDRYDSPPWDMSAEHRRRVFTLVDAAFAQRRKTMRAALTGWAGSAAEAERAMREADIDPHSRGETLTTEQFVALADAAQRLSIGTTVART